jgi:hypothetical protein
MEHRYSKFKRTVQAVIAVYGFQFFWVGIWTLIDSYGRDYRLYRDLIFIALGLAGTAASGTLFFYAGLLEHHPERLDHTRSFDGIVSLSTSILLWLGFYSIMDFTLPPMTEPSDDFGSTTEALWKYFLAFVFGMALLFFAGSLIELAGMTEDEEELLSKRRDLALGNSDLKPSKDKLFNNFDEDAMSISNIAEKATISRNSDCICYAWKIFRALASLLGQTGISYGGYALFDNFISCDGYEPLAFLFLIATGLLIIHLSDSFVAQSLDLEDTTTASSSEESMSRTEETFCSNKAALHLRSIGVIFGSALHDNAAWILIDEYIFADAWSYCATDGIVRNGCPVNCTQRNIAYMLFGICLIIATRTDRLAFGKEIRLPGFPAGLGRMKHRIHIPTSS